MDLHLNPFYVPFEVDTIRFFICDRVRAIGTIKSLRQWVSTLMWVSECLHASKEWRRNQSLCTLIRALQKQYAEEKDIRLPIKVDYIRNYMIKKGATTTKLMQSMPFDKLLAIVVLVLTWFLGNRPSEVLKYSTKHSTNGLRIEDVEWKPQYKCFSILIKSFKNQKSKKVFMEKQIPSTKCSNPQCTVYCTILNPMKLLKIYQQKRVLLHKQIAAKLQQQPSDKKLKQLFKKVRYHKNSYLFIKQNGEIFKTTDLNKVIKEVVQINNLEEPKRYTAYSLRIGCTTQQQAMGIPHPKILRYIGWAESRLPSIAMRYMRYTKANLRQVPFELIHGSLMQDNFTLQRKFMNMNNVFDPWTNKINFKPYKNKTNKI